MPEAVIIAGCNGAGKTTFARQLLPSLYPGLAFFNVDEISREEDPPRHPVRAGKELMARLANAVRTRQSFVIETTLSSRFYERQIQTWRDSGYLVVLHFIGLATADMAVRRVAERVAAGGHDVPETDIRRRFTRGRALFNSRYKEIVDEWYLWESNEEGMRFVNRSTG
jgi:predicted ABC-type ATPase